MANDHASHGARSYPDVVGQYDVEGVLGEGGMGVVVAARHRTLGHAVAIKFLTSKVVGDQVAVARFLREAKATLGIENEHVVRIMEVGTLDTGAPYMVMERLVGQDLHSLVAARGFLGVSEAVDYLLQACEAIAEAHAIGIVHRDLKPENLFLTKRRDGSPFVKVLDFGISKWTEADKSFSLTATASVMGSPFYMSPEQVRSSKSVDRRADVWALGVVLHELLAGEPPFQGESLGAIHAAIVSDPPTPLRALRSDIPLELEAIVLRCLEKKAADRCSDVPTLARALLPFANLAKDSVTRILRDSNAMEMPVGEPSSTATTSAPIVNVDESARSATVEGWGTEADRDRGRRRIAQTGVGLAVLVLLVGLGIFGLRQRSTPDVSAFSERSGSGAAPPPAATSMAPYAEGNRPVPPAPALTTPDPVASAPEVASAAHSSAEIRRRPPVRPPRPAPVPSIGKVALPPPSPLDGRK